MADWVIEDLGGDHDRASFSCGQFGLDDFIRTRVSQYDKRRLGKTFVAVRSGEKRVIGYYTLAAGGVPFDHVPVSAARKLPRHPVPVVLLARLAVDISAQGQVLGEGLLLDALQRSLDLSGRLGIHAVTVDTVDKKAVGFYLKYGFIPLLDRPLHLILPLATVAKVLGQDSG